MQKRPLYYAFFLYSASVPLFCYALERGSKRVMSQSSEHYRPKRPKLFLEPRNLTPELNNKGEKTVWRAKLPVYNDGEKKVWQAKLPVYVVVSPLQSAGEHEEDMCDPVQKPPCKSTGFNPLTVMMQSIEKNHSESDASPAMSKKPPRLHIETARDSTSTIIPIPVILRQPCKRLKF